MRTRSCRAKFLSTVFAVSSAAVLFSGMPAASSAQEQDDARVIAGAVQAFYNQTTGVRSSFYQTYYSKLYNRYDRSRGIVTFAKPGRMHWQYASPNGKVITSDGAQLFVYDPGDANETGQCFQREMNEHQLPQAFSFLTGSGRLEEDFTFRLLDAARQGYREGYVLELRPRAPTPHYDRILFYVMRQNDRPSGVVRRVLIVDAAGNRNRFDFSNMQWNPNVGRNHFRFTPPRGITCTRP
jgi:outer membrane lipoprotein carrier protein